jgi:3',5'-cyclic AMP phosphodiesterase CpdA
MKLEPRLDELRLRVDVARGSPTLILAVVPDDEDVDDARRALLGLLGAAPMSVADLGACSDETGPMRWAALTRAQAADAYVLTYVPRGRLSGRPFAVLLNTEREILHDLAGPLVLVVSRATEQILREHAPDFVTWSARPYELPSAAELRALAGQLGALPTEGEPAEPEEEPIRFLHVSDLHLRPAIVKRYDQDRVLRGLVEFLARDREGFPLDLVFVTGDLAHSGRADEYALVVELLRKLMEVTGVPAERTFVVPGNHDVDRAVGKWLLRTLAGYDDAVAFFEEAKSRVFHEQKLAAYRESMGGLLGKGRPLGIAVGEDAVELVDVRGARLAVASFNSAWFAQGEDDRGNLWLGEPNVDRAGQRVADLEAPFAVALMHHPLDYLDETERDNVEHYLERSFDLVLRGHLHKERTRAITSARGGYVEVAGPAAYQGSQWPNGCFLGEIRTKARTVRLRPYMFASGADPWVVDTKVFPDDEEGGHRHTFVVPAKRRLKSSVTKRLERATEEAVREASSAKIEKLANQLGVTRPDQPGPRDIVDRTVRAARAQAEDPVLWQDANARRARLAWYRDIDITKLGSSITRDEPKFLEHTLWRAGKWFLRARSLAKGRIDWSSIDDEVMWNTAMSVLDAPVRNHVDYPWLIRLVGASGEPDEHHAVIVERRLDQQGNADAGFVMLDRYLVASNAVHGALVLFNALAYTETEPQLEHVKTPAGRDVLLLRL